MLSGVVASCIAGVSLAVTGYGLLRMSRFAAARHSPPHVAPGARVVPTVSAVVPARDEASGIADCVQALLATGVAEVVVVDDGSSDGTAALVRGLNDPRVRVVTAAAGLPGALGKPAACAHGAAIARSEWLWFVDADVTVAPDALARLLAAADEHGVGLVSAMGRLHRAGPATAWLLPEVGLALARRLDLDRAADSTDDVAFASGQCLLVRRDVYATLGGHHAVLDQAVEDVAFARLAKRRGVAARVLLAPELYRVTMYSSIREAWKGLVRNSAIVRGTRPADCVREGAYAFATATPLVLLAAGRSSPLAAAAYLSQIVVSGGGRAVGGMPVWPAVAAPLAEVALIANWAQSAWLRRRGATVSWRGRPVAVG